MLPTLFHINSKKIFELVLTADNTKNKNMQKYSNTEKIGLNKALEEVRNSLQFLVVLAILKNSASNSRCKILKRTLLHR